MWTYEALRDAVAPLVGLSDAEAAAALAAQTVEEIRDIPTADVRAILLESGEWAAIKLTAQGGMNPAPPAPIVAACVTVIDTLSLTTTLVTTREQTSQALVAMCEALVTAGLASEASASAILALRTDMVPVWQPPPTEHDVARARSLEE